MCVKAKQAFRVFLFSGRITSAASAVFFRPPLAAVYQGRIAAQPGLRKVTETVNSKLNINITVRALFSEAFSH